MKNLFKFQMLIVLIIILIVTCKAWGLDPAPEPNDAPFTWDPNEVDPNYPAFDWLETDPNQSITYLCRICTNYDSSMAEPNTYITMHDQYGSPIPIAWERLNKSPSGKLWVQTLEIKWTESIYSAGQLLYYKLEARDHVGVIIKGTLLCNVKEQRKGYFYPIGENPPVADIREIWQHAKSIGMLPELKKLCAGYRFMTK